MDNIIKKIKSLWYKTGIENLDLKTDNKVKVLIYIVTALLITLMLPKYKDIDTEFEVGSVWSREDLIAPFSFPIYREDDDYQKEKEEVAKSIAPIFDEIPDADKKTTDSLKAFFSVIDEILSDAARAQSEINSQSFDIRKESIPIVLDEAEWSKIYSSYDSNPNRDSAIINYSSFKNLINSALADISQLKIIGYDKAKLLSGKISVKKENNKAQDITQINDIYDKNEAMKIAGDKISAGIKDSIMLSLALKISRLFLKEDYVFDEELTRLELQNRIDQIPRTLGIVRENERIISKHDPINGVTKLKLDSYKKVRLERIGVQDYFARYVGRVLSVFITLLILILYLYYIRKKIYGDNLLLALISSLILIVCLNAYFTMNTEIAIPVEFLIFTSVASILLTIIFDSRVSFWSTVVICMLIAMIRGGDFIVLFVSLTASALSIFSVRDVKNRSQIFRSFFFLITGYAVTIIAIGLDRVETSEKIIQQLLFGGINSILSPIIAYGLLIFYERTFRITTDLTLLELSDFNHPLLRELSSKAPGTFHHSVLMGNLSEAAAKAIGANQILTRVGCYYHDIGKIARPEFFIENQMGQHNRHDTLNPNISTKIIISHVKQGVDFARKHNLPQEIINFIPMHHGTTLVSYFYDKAKKDTNKEEIQDHAYRYPGPKPQTKETGIVMLADTVEAATRTIEDPTPQKLEHRIDDIIKKRFIEGELDECDLTLKDLTNIKKAFLTVLLGIHHHRVKYPEEMESKSN